MKEEKETEKNKTPKFRTLPSTDQVPFSVHKEKNTRKIIEFLKTEKPTDKDNIYAQLQQEHIVQKTNWSIIQQRFLYLATKGNHKEWFDFLLNEEKISPFFVYPNEKQRKMSLLSISASLDDHTIFNKLLDIYNHDVYDGHDSTLLYEYLKSSTFNTEKVKHIKEILSRHYTQEKIKETIEEAFKSNHILWFQGHFKKEKLDYYQSEGLFDNDKNENDSLEIKNKEPYIAQILKPNSLQEIKDIENIIEKKSEFLKIIKNYNPDVLNTENKHQFNYYAFFHQLVQAIIDYGIQEDTNLFKKISEKEKNKIFNYLISFYYLLKEKNEFDYQQLMPKNTPIFATLFRKISSQENFVDYLINKNNKKNNSNNDNFPKLKEFFDDIINQYNQKEIENWTSTQNQNLIHYICEGQKPNKVKSVVKLIDYINEKYGIDPTTTCFFDSVKINDNEEKEQVRTSSDAFIILLKKINKIEIFNNTYGYGGQQNNNNHMESFNLLVKTFKKYDYFNSDFSIRKHPLGLTVQLSLSSLPDTLNVWGESEINENWVEINKNKFITILNETGFTKELSETIANDIEKNKSHSKEADEYKNFVQKYLLEYYYKTNYQEKKNTNKPIRF